MLRNETFALRGDVRELGYFTATVWLGTPPRRFELIVDTGSTITYIPCVDCGDRCGPNHENMWFDPAASSTSSYVSCSDSGCDCGSPPCGCRDDSRCTYVRSYVEGSKSAGYLLRDAMTLHDGAKPPTVVFGCEESEAGEIYRQKADGLLGLGRSSASVLDQLVRAGELEDAFSLCFGTFDGDGALLLGSAARATGEDGGEAARAGLLAPPAPLPRVVETPLLRRPDHPYFYTVDLTDMAVGGTSLAVHADAYSTGYGAVLDSGTTFAYLPQSVYGAIVLRVREHAIAHGLTQVPGPDPSFADICFAGADPDGDPEKLAQVFPNLTLTFRPMPTDDNAANGHGNGRRRKLMRENEGEEREHNVRWTASTMAHKGRRARVKAAAGAAVGAGTEARSSRTDEARRPGALFGRIGRALRSLTGLGADRPLATGRRLADDADADASTTFDGLDDASSSSSSDLPQSVIDAIESTFEAPVAATLADDASAEETYDAFSGVSRSAPPPPSSPKLTAASSASSSSSSSSRRVLHELTVGPSNYLFVHTKHSGKYCLGVFDNGKQGALLGGILFRNTLLEYDRANSKIRFVPGVACSRLGNALKPACEDMFPNGGGDVAAAGFNGSTQAQIAEDQGDCRAKSAEALAWWPEEAPADDEIALARGEGDDARRAAKRRKDLIILGVLGGVLFIVLGATVYAVILSGVTGRAARAVLPSRWAPGAGRSRRSRGDEERISLVGTAATSDAPSHTGDDGGVGHPVENDTGRSPLGLGGIGHNPTAYAGVAGSAAEGTSSSGRGGFASGGGSGPARNAKAAAPGASSSSSAPTFTSSIAMARLFRFGRDAAPPQDDLEASATPLQGLPRAPTPPGIDAVQGLGPRPEDLSADASLSLSLGSSVEAAAGREAEGYVVREDLDDAFAGGVALGATGGEHTALNGYRTNGNAAAAATAPAANGADVESLLPRRTPSSGSNGRGSAAARTASGTGKQRWFAAGNLFGRGKQDGEGAGNAPAQTAAPSAAAATNGQAPSTIPLDAPPATQPGAPSLPVSSMASMAETGEVPASYPSRRRLDDDEFETIGRDDDAEPHRGAQPKDGAADTSKGF